MAESEVSHTISEIRKLTTVIKGKERELDKERTEIQYTERDSSLLNDYKQKRTIAEQRKTSALDTLQNRMEVEKEKVEKEIAHQKNQLDTYIENQKAKIAAIEKAMEIGIEKHQNKVCALEKNIGLITKKYSEKKSRVQCEEDGHIAYFQSEIDRIESTNTSNSKIRGLECDLLNLYKDLSTKQEMAYGVSFIPDYPYLEPLRKAKATRDAEKEARKKVVEPTALPEQKPTPVHQPQEHYLTPVKPIISDTQTQFPKIIGNTKKLREIKIAGNK